MHTDLHVEYADKAQEYHPTIELAPMLCTILESFPSVNSCAEIAFNSNLTESRAFILISQDADMTIGTGVYRTLDAAIAAGDQVVLDRELVLDNNDELLLRVDSENNADITICFWNGDKTGQTYMWVETTTIN